MDDTYCMEEIWPNLKWMFVIPKIIFSVFNMLINGRWYNPPSGLFELSSIIVIKLIELISMKLKRISLYLILSINKYIIRPNNKIPLFNVGLRLIKKFKNSATKVKKITPNNIIS